MTTIAYKNGVMAADTLTTANGTRVGYSQKIVKTASGRLVGAAGFGPWCDRLRLWADTENGEPPLPADGEGNGIVVEPDGEVVMLFHGGSYRCDAPYHATGSGTEHALAVMEFGGSAEDAVRVSIVLDTASGGSITVLSLGAE